mmetsp:Transcript_3642/g.7894  ORF Transcript_3642/g.7894 Transcript_3642/m.7894 type:complete len:173 (+) Transcript_3642:127-645(+)
MMRLTTLPVRQSAAVSGRRWCAMPKSPLFSSSMTQYGSASLGFSRYGSQSGFASCQNIRAVPEVGEDVGKDVSIREWEKEAYRRSASVAGASGALVYMAAGACAITSVLAAFDSMGLVDSRDHLVLGYALAFLAFTSISSALKETFMFWSLIRNIARVDPKLAQEVQERCMM